MFLIVPWQGTVKLPAVLEAAEASALFAPRPAKIEEIFISQGNNIEKGTILLSLQSDELLNEIRQTRLQVQLSEIMLNRQAANSDERARRLLFERNMESAMAKLAVLENQQKALEVKSPITGRVVEIESSIKSGIWINEDAPLAYIVNPSKARLRGFVSEAQLGRFSEGNGAIFYPDHLNVPSLKATVQTISKVNTPVLNDLQLASIKGQMHIEGTKESIIGNLFRNVWSILIRESGF